MQKDIFEESVELHQKYGGKLAVASKIHINNRHDLSLAYTPGVARVCEEIAKDKDKVFDLSIKRHTVAVVTDGSAVLGLGNIGPEAALPVMEGKAVLFKEYANIDAFPICLTTQDSEEIIETIQRIAPVFGGINLEDISAPRCFEIESRLQNLGIPVFHDDQHGTAIVVLAGLLNAAKVTGKPINQTSVVINGSGAAGTAIADLLNSLSLISEYQGGFKEILVCDTKGILSESREDLQQAPAKLALAKRTNPFNKRGSLSDAFVDADVFLGVSVGNVVTKEMVQKMAPNAVVLAMANPIPEIMPQLAVEAGAAVVGTGRSDFPNQINNVLAFPGIFRGALDARAKVISEEMKLASAIALANYLKSPTPNEIIPSVLDKQVTLAVADAVKKAALATVN